MGAAMEVDIDRRLDGAEVPARLRAWVHEIYEIGFTPPGGGPLRMPISAITEPVLNLTLSGRVTLELGGRGPLPLPPLTLAGPQPGAYTATVAGRIHGFDVRFAPVGPLALLGVRDYALTPAGIPPLDGMVRPGLQEAVRALEKALLAADGFDERVQRTLDFLAEHADEPDARVRFLDEAVRILDDRAGSLRIAELASRLGVSESTLRRRFAALGMPPKRFASVLRFRRAHHYLTTAPDASWAEAVVRFGYADQAHLIREYCRFSGAPPTRWDHEPRHVDRRMGIEGEEG